MSFTRALELLHMLDNQEARHPDVAEYLDGLHPDEDALVDRVVSAALAYANAPFIALSNDLIRAALELERAREAAAAVKVVKAVNYGDAAWGASNGFSPEPREAVAASTQPTEAAVASSFVSPEKNREALETIDSLLEALLALSRVYEGPPMLAESVIKQLRWIVDGAR